jgi:hypothetical protein
MPLGMVANIALPLYLTSTVYSFHIKAGNFLYKFRCRTFSQCIPGNFNRFLFSPYLFTPLPPYFLTFPPCAVKPADPVW